MHVLQEDFTLQTNQLFEPVHGSSFGSRDGAGLGGRYLLGEMVASWALLSYVVGTLLLAARLCAEQRADAAKRGGSFISGIN